VTAVDGVDPQRLLTPEDLAELLQVDRETVYRMARRGELPAIKVARHWRFRATRIDRWLADLETGEHHGR
jgi:excisionase family DNA binding protein